MVVLFELLVIKSYLFIDVWEREFFVKVDLLFELGDFLVLDDLEFCSEFWDLLVFEDGYFLVDFW